MNNKDIYLCAFYAQKPRDGVKTHIAGWMKNPDNIQYDESVEITRGLSSKDRQHSNIVLNLTQKVVVCNKFDTDQRDFDALFKHFLESYPKYVIQVMAQLDMAYLEKFIPDEDDSDGDDSPEIVNSVDNEHSPDENVVE